MQIILRAEQRRHTFQKIKNYVRKEKQGLSSVVIPPHTHPLYDNEEEEFIITKEEMESTLIERHRKHLHQAHESSVVQSGCIELLKNKENQNKILNRTFETKVDECFNNLAKSFKRKAKERNNTITKEALIQE